MIGTALGYLRKRVDTHLRSVLDLERDGSTADRVVFVEGDKLDPFTVPLGTIGMVVVNVQEEREFRDANRYLRPLADGPGSLHHHPDLHLEVSLLFVAKFKDYANAWNQLSHVMGFFQIHSVFDASADRDLPSGVKRLAGELVSLTFQQQNEIWSSLKTSLHPAVLYRFRCITMQGPPLEEQPRQVRTVEARVLKEIHLRAPPLVPPLMP
jgi:hypothetical protein